MLKLFGIFSEVWFLHTLNTATFEIPRSWQVAPDKELNILIV